MNQIANTISQEPQAWFGKYKHFKVTKAIYASYDAFSQVDVVVTCHLPGAVSTYVIDGRGEHVQETDRIWLGVFASSVMRSLVTTDDEEEQVNAIVESRALDPFSSPDLAKLFLHAFEELFYEGPNIGCAPEVQTASLVQNYLVDALLKTVELTGLYDEALEILERLRTKEESVVALIVKVLLLKDEEVKAVKALYDGIQKTPRDPELLLIESQFLIKKGKLTLALKSAIDAVNSAPSEFNYWANLSKVYLELGDIEQSLFTLNSCPMAAFKEKYHLKRLLLAPADKVHLPLPNDVTLEDVVALDTNMVAQEHRSIDQALANLPAAKLKTTLAKAYNILTEIVHRTGWEALLKYRARIFVMEEEYRSKSTSQTNIAENGNVNADDGFKQKRLCERWLDNLFMILYDDLKTYTMWQAELIHFQAQRTVYEKLPIEWEYLGMCAFRLHHYKEASVAFQNALETRFAPVCTRNLLKYYLLEAQGLQKQALHSGANGSADQASVESAHQIERKLDNLDNLILELIVKLTAWNHRWYSEFAPYLVKALGTVVEREGLVKVENEISAGYAEETGVAAMMNDYFQFFKLFNRPGADS